MPVIELTLIEGYDEQTRTRLGESLTDAVRSIIDAPLDGVTVEIHEVKAESYMRGRQARQPGKPQPDPVGLVQSFLSAMEARDLDRARGFLADGFRMTFPGGAEFERLEQLVEWARSRYRSVRKTYDRFDVTADANGPIVYCFGTLAGEWLDGAGFSGIRFIDRFSVRDGLFTDQLVWNDLAEAGRQQ
jgi:phenylpyruvate tautomerase PptA (4-oxalocrotonate tautomerase family)